MTEWTLQLNDGIVDLLRRRELRRKLKNSNALVPLHELVDAAERIEPLPASVTRLLALTNDPNSSMDQLAEVIHYDPVLASDVLRRANSARSAARDTIVEVKTALARLGTSEVMSLAMSRAMHGRMTVALPAYGMDAHELWRHSLSSAIAAEAIADLSTNRIPGHASTAALLHDVGKLVISKALPRAVAEVMARTLANDSRPLHEVERAILGTDHGDVGATVLRSWDFPMSMQMALTNHHNPAHASDTLSHVVSAANAISLALSSSASEPTKELATLDRSTIVSLNQCGIVESAIPALFELASTRFDEVMAAYGQ